MLIPELEPYCGSWICTSPTGEIREFFDRQNAEKAYRAGWSIETAANYLGAFNSQIKNRSGLAMTLLAPPDTKAEDIFHQIILLAKSCALVTDERNGSLVIMLPEKQRSLDLREKALEISSMCEMGSEASEDIEVTPVWPKKRIVCSRPRVPKVKQDTTVVELFT